MTGIGGSATQGEHKVVTTLSFLGDMAKGIGEDNVEVTTLISGSVDPHNYEPTPSDLTALTEADLIITTGQEEFDGWFQDFLDDNPEFASKVFQIESDRFLKHDPLVDELNPHYWLSPLVMKEVATLIFEKFQDLFQISEKGLEKVQARLDSLMEKINSTKKALQGMKVVVDHPAFFYLLDLLGIERVGAIEEKEGVDPSPSHIQDLVDLMRAENITQIIASEVQAGSDVVELASKTGARISYLNVNPTEINGTGYFKMMETNLDHILNPEDPNTKVMDTPIWTVSFVFAMVFLSGVRKRRRMI